MRAIVSIALIALLCGICLAPINAVRICASRKKNVENLSVPENVSNGHNVGHPIVSYCKVVIFLRYYNNLFLSKLCRIYSV